MTDHIADADKKVIAFTVPGVPRPGGSKRGFINKKTGRVMLVKAGGQAEENWRQAVAYAALAAMKSDMIQSVQSGAARDPSTWGPVEKIIRPPLDCPVRLDITFYMPRPKAHYGKGGLKKDAPEFHSTRPDRGKLLRSTEDAMTGIVYRDDSQVCDGVICKRYGERPGAEIKVTKCASL